jgi:excisionase family DNA binding protein
MDELPKTMLDLFFDQVRLIVREELARSGNGAGNLLTAEQLAEKLQVDESTVYRWVKEKRIPYYESGRFVRFNLKEVLECQKRNPS